MLDVKLNKSLEKKSEYRGCCDDYGRRDGYGSETWRKLEQTYEGTFFKDSFHGEGSYKRLTGKETTVFEGHFYSSLKEGYGLVSYPDGSVFEGLFNNNQAFGPGVYTHVNGRQDVGFWCGNKIVRLCRSVDFIVPRLSNTPIGKLKLLQFQSLLPFVEENVDVGAAMLLKHGVQLNQSFRLYSNFIQDPRSLFFNRIHFDKVYFVKIEVPEGTDNPDSAEENINESGESSEVNPHTPQNVYSSSEKMDVEDDTFVRGEEDPCEGIHVIAWNRSELCMDMLKQIFRFRSFEDKLSFKISDLMAGERLKFRKTGEIERFCVHFLKMCSIGPCYIIKEMLCTGSISEELMDARGNNSVMFAVASDQHDIIHLLLNNGVDVNSFNDENLTPLNFSLLRRISQTYSLGNWEVCFLSPNDSSILVNNEKICDLRKSVESLDRILGDGMSILSEKAVEERKELDESDSVFCFQGENDSKIETSEITLFHYKTGEEEKNLVSGRDELRERMEIQPPSYKREEFLQSVAPPTDRDKYFFDFSSETPRNIRKFECMGESEIECSGSFEEKIINIDKTIELLLSRGADPNLADAPKPSIHLAIYCMEPKLVRLLLSYGASPDTQSLPQEGLLTPLHVVVLMKPSLEQVEICELLLNHGASPEEETSATFTPDDEEFLDDDHGRTPLQLLCSRKGADHLDDQGFLRQVTSLLAKVSKKHKFFKGHSYLTLCMMCGNYNIMEAILKCRGINPNEILGQNLGTPFHVLVSADLQKRTSFENSIRMCDLLLENGGNPNITFETPESLIGTCIDYGYREVENEKHRRKSESGKIKKKDERYNVEDHVKVIEYIVEKSKQETKNLDGSNGTRKKSRRKDDKGSDNVGKGLKDMENNGIATKKVKRALNDNSSFVEMKKDMETPKENSGSRTRDTAQIEGMSKGKENPKVANIEKTKPEGKENSKVANIEKAKPEGKENSKAVNIEKAKSEVKENSKVVEIKKYAAANKEKFSGSAKKTNKSVDNGKKKETTKNLNENKASTRNIGKSSRSETVKGKDYSEKLPEKFRQSLLHMFGICGGLNLNDLLLPYVVLRNGDLYYRFKGQKLSRTEQYSLI